MRFPFLLFLIVIVLPSYGQSSNPASPAIKKGSSASHDTAGLKFRPYFPNLPTWEFSGLGNLNEATLQNVNASGAIAGAIRPLLTNSVMIQTDLKFNINASTSDSLLSTTLIFPETGSNNFYGKLTGMWEIPF